MSCLVAVCYKDGSHSDVFRSTADLCQSCHPAGNGDDFILQVMRRNKIAKLRFHQNEQGVDGKSKST